MRTCAVAAVKAWGALLLHKQQLIKDGFGPAIAADVMPSDVVPANSEESSGASTAAVADVTDNQPQPDMASVAVETTATEAEGSETLRKKAKRTRNITRRERR